MARLSILVAGLVLAPVARADTVTIKGSDTMLVLAQQWMEHYRREHPTAVLQLTGGGSETGIAALTNGTTDIAAASRPMTDAEVARAEARHDRRIVQIPVAYDALAIVVNEANPVDVLTLSDLARVFRGEVQDWKELGGSTAPIAIYGRDHSSGSWTFFRRQVLHDDDFSVDALNLVGTASIVDSVAKDVNGIGYGGIAYAGGLKHVRLAKDAGGTPVAATVESVRNGTYPLARRLWLHVTEPHDEDVARFLAWVRGPAGQGVVAGVGFFPLQTEGAGW
ncbi:MAG: PstS family phosphate ABC transporter substrate-binding protein [Deltaproteobacteria bacterium]|nr:PstS family phosphate ABC transporter substrate-binding protein [Deltaproteobacteria bacterium]